MTGPRVSIVMSAYNDASRVGRAVRSMLAQTFADFELIAIDDGSTDDSADEIGKLAAADGRIRLVRQQNTGLTAALIHGCALARAPYIARQDADDWSHPERLEDQLALLESDERLGFVSCATEYVGPGDEHLTVVRRPGDPERATDGLLNARLGPPAHGSVMFRRAVYEAAGGYRPQFYYSQDSDLWLRMAERSLIGYVDAVRYHHRKDSGSISGARRGQQSEFARNAHACRAARLSGESEQPWLEACARLGARIRDGRELAPGPHGYDIDYLIGSQLTRNRDARARAYLWATIRRSPWHWRAWLRLLQSAALSQVRR